MGVQILIADDNLHFRKALKSALSHHRNWIVCGDAADGAEAVTLAAALAPDVILLDLQMPRLNGLLAAQEILKANPATPIILFTMHDHAPFEDEARKIGIRKVISKGEIGALLDSIEEVLHLQSSSGLSTASSPPRSSPRGEEPKH